MNEAKQLIAVLSEKVKDRFWSKVERRGPNDYWLWIAYCDTDGYGRFRLDGEKRCAHRVSWMLHFGAIPPGLLVCHSCDVPQCVNTNHLFLGTHLDNVRDMKIKGRGNYSKGEANGAAKLTRAQVEEIRAKYGPGTTLICLAREYKTTQGNISCIVNRKIWRHV